MQLKDRVCVVTGAAGGIGQQIARTYTEAGAKVAVLDVQKEKAEAAAAEIGAKAWACDLSSVQEIGRTFGQIAAEWGRVDVLVNCAALTNRTTIGSITEAEWDSLCDVNLKGLFFAAQEAFRLMERQGGGKIINISSLRAFQSDGRHLIYEATKAGVQAVTRCFAVAGGPLGIATNSISPGYVITPMTAHNLKRPNWLEQMYARIPFKRLLEMQEIANVALFLASDLSSGINGEDILVDGGWRAHE